MVLEGESLLNDASSFTLFFVFTSYLKKSAGSYAQGDALAKAASMGSTAANANWTVVLASVIKDTLVLGLGGWLGSHSLYVLAVLRRLRSPQHVRPPAGGQASCSAAEQLQHRKTDELWWAHCAAACCTACAGGRRAGMIAVLTEGQQAMTCRLADVSTRIWPSTLPPRPPPHRRHGLWRGLWLACSDDAAPHAPPWHGPRAADRADLGHGVHGLLRGQLSWQGVRRGGGGGVWPVRSCH
jgi:hypothetical protein